METVNDMFKIEANKIKPFSIIPRVFEDESENFHGIELKNLKTETKYLDNVVWEDYVFFSEGFNHSLDTINERILDKYKSISGHCSIIIDDSDDLMNHIENIYRVCYFHSVWAKEMKLCDGSFPNNCCGISSRNIFLSLMDLGYPNVSYLYNNQYDHAYVGLPFVFGDNSDEGFIIVDPTSEQLFDDKKIAPRNNIFVAYKTWKYETDRMGGVDLYPSLYDGSTFANLYTLREFPKKNIFECNMIEEYFKHVFNNTVKFDFYNNGFI